VQESVGWEQRGVATASTMFFRSIGGAIAVGALGALLAASLGDSVPEGALNALLAPGDHARALDPSVALALSRGLQRLFWAVAGIASGVVVAGLLFPNERVVRRAAGTDTPVVK
jgi:hypothetical protein